MADKVKFLGHPGSGLRQSIGALLSNSKVEQEDQEEMPLSRRDAVDVEPGQVERDGGLTEEIDALVIDVVDTVIARVDKEEEPLRSDDSSLRSAPSWEIGPQRYGDPSLWRPAQVEESLTEDKDYRELYKVVQEIR